MKGIIEESDVKIKAKTNFSLSKSGDLVTKLKDWRRSISQDTGLPAYMILHDRTIIDIAVKIPLTSQDLEKVMGLGPAKIMKYGEDILSLVSG
jgi:ATP-dependent DNA helicase RecQ